MKVWIILYYSKQRIEYRRNIGCNFCTPKGTYLVEETKWKIIHTSVL